VLELWVLNLYEKLQSEMEEKENVTECRRNLALMLPRCKATKLKNSEGKFQVN
jgi:hypothetical protein